MAKCLVVGASLFTYKDKKTGDSKSMLSLHSVRNTAKVFGKAVEEIVISDDSPLFDSIFDCVPSSDELVGYVVDVDRDKRGFIENLEVLDKSEDCVIWGF